MRTYDDSLLGQITRERDIAMDAAKRIITEARYGEREYDLTPNEMAHEVFVARVSQWNAAAVFRWKSRQLMRPIKVA